MAGAAAAGRPIASRAAVAISAHPPARRTAATLDSASASSRAACYRKPGACRIKSPRVADPPHIERISKAVAKQIERHDRHYDGQPWKDADPPRLTDEISTLVERQSPGWGRGIDAQTEIGQRRFRENAQTDREGELHRQWGDEVRSDVSEHHLPISCAKGTSRQGEILL